MFLIGTKLSDTPTVVWCVCVYTHVDWGLSQLIHTLSAVNWLCLKMPRENLLHCNSHLLNLNTAISISVKIKACNQRLINLDEQAQSKLKGLKHFCKSCHCFITYSSCVGRFSLFFLSSCLWWVQGLALFPDQRGSVEWELWRSHYCQHAAIRQRLDHWGRGPAYHTRFRIQHTPGGCVFASSGKCCVSLQNRLLHQRPQHQLYTKDYYYFLNWFPFTSNCSTHLKNMIWQCKY